MTRGLRTERLYRLPSGEMVDWNPLPYMLGLAVGGVAILVALVTVLVMFS